jgi:predicted DNA-binding antitoxin AbrB/MazE fold protein
MQMQAVKGFFNGEKIVPLEKVPLKENQKVIITILDEYMHNEKIDKPHRRYFGKLDNESYKEIVDAIQDCEKVDYNEA